MPSPDEIVQLSESIEYPDGYNKVVVEGTGDEGILSNPRYPVINISVRPTFVYSDGISVSTISAEVDDRDDQEFYKVQEIIADITSTENIGLSLPHYIVEIRGELPDGRKGTLSTGETMGVYTYDGSVDEFGNKIPGDLIVLDSEVPFQRQRVKFANYRPSPNDGSQGYRYLVIYKGVATVSFNVGADNNEWYTVEEFPTIDPPWTLPVPTEPGGVIIPTLCPFGKPGALPGDWEESRTISGGYQRSAPAYMPNFGDAGEATLNVNYNSFKRSTRLMVMDGSPLGDASIEVRIEPSSIIVNDEQASVECIVKTADGLDPGEHEVFFDMYSSPAPPTYGAVQWIGGQTRTLGVILDREEYVSSSDKYTVTLPYMVKRVISIEAAPTGTPPWSWTWDNVVTINGTTLYIPESNALPLDSTPLKIKFDATAVASTTVVGISLGEVTIVARLAGKTPTGNLTIETASGIEDRGSDFELEAIPDNLNYGEVAQVIATFTGEPSPVAYTWEPSGDESVQLAKRPGYQIGTLIMPALPSLTDWTEQVRASDRRHVTATKEISSLTSIHSDYGSHRAFYASSIADDNVTIELSQSLSDQELNETLTLVYKTGKVAQGTYTAPGNKMTVAIKGKMRDGIPKFTTVSTNMDCKNWQFELVSCEPEDILNAAKDTKGPQGKIYPDSPMTNVVVKILEEKIDEPGVMIPSVGVRVRAFVDPDLSKSFEGGPGCRPGYPVAVPTSGFGVPAIYPGYVDMKSDAEGKLRFGIMPGTGQTSSRTTITLEVRDSITGGESECRTTTTYSFETSGTVFEWYDAVIGTIDIYIAAMAVNRSGYIEVDQFLTVSDGAAVSSYGCAANAAENGGYCAIDPRTSPVNLTYTIPNFYAYGGVSRIWLDGEGYTQFSLPLGDHAKLTGDTGNDYTSPTGPVVSIEFIPKYRYNTYTYTFTIVSATNSNQVVPGARVELVNTRDMLDRSVVYSDSSGQVTYYGLQAGQTYEVYITHSGYRANSLEAANLSGDLTFDYDTENDTITIPNYGYDDNDRYYIEGGTHQIRLMGRVGRRPIEDITVRA